MRPSLQPRRPSPGQLIAKENGGLRVDLNLPPEIAEALRRGNVRIEVKVGPVTVQPVVNVAPPAPPVMPVDRWERPAPTADRDRLRASAVRDRSAPRTIGSIRDHFIQLVRRGELLQQSDWRLGQRGLLVPDGGLCASTSAVNVLHAAFSHLGRDTSRFHRADDLVARLVSRAWEQLGRDARMGLDFNSLATVVNYVANGIHPDVGVHATKPYFWRRGNSVDLEVLRGDADTMSLLCVTTGASSAHAIALVDIDERRQTVTYSDPNYPQQLLERRYWPNGQGSIRIDGFNGYGDLTDVLHIRTKNFEYSASEDWSKYSGQRVYMTTRDGRRHLTSIDRIEGPTPEYPNGRAIAYDMTFGSGGGGTTPLEEIAKIERVEAPSKQKIASYQRFVGEKVRFRFDDPYLQDRYGQTTFAVEEVTDEKKKDEHPFGGLRVREVGKQWGTNGVLGFERIAGVELVDDRLAARGPHADRGTTARRTRNVI